jgi:hypothetical protein
LDLQLKSAQWHINPACLAHFFQQCGIVGKKVAEATEARYSVPIVVLSSILLVRVDGKRRKKKRVTVTLYGHEVVVERWKE